MRHNGLYLLQKSRSDTCVLKDLLQFLRVQNPGKAINFSYIEAGSSLIPHLTLWENLHVAVGGAGWKDFVAALPSEYRFLTNHIAEPNTLVSVAPAWDRLITGLLKGLVTESQNLLVDMNEDLHSPLNLQNFKKIIETIGTSRQVYLATSNTSLWLDTCYGLVTRKGYEFSVEYIGEDGAGRSALKRRHSA